MGTVPRAPQHSPTPPVAPHSRGVGPCGGVGVAGCLPRCGDCVGVHALRPQWVYCGAFFFYLFLISRMFGEEKVFDVFCF